ncbi:hypothetical protein HDU76_000835 [Blyttiomyces sp. JEL0837]|nr:hypothetical protein HDU76_000835 [Blyttiomyces sp. JEL0837]
MALLKDLHIKYIVSLDEQKDRFEYWISEHLRLNGVYWGLTALILLKAPDALKREDVIAYVLSCQHEDGSFGGHVGHDGHLLYTLSAVQVLATLDALDKINPDQIATYIKSLQRPDGSFSGDEWGEVDTRFSYCALSCLSLLGKLDSVDVEKATQFIERCRNFDGGYGSVPGAESHAGQIFCCVGALAIVGALHLVDVDRLGWWLAERQLKNGGLNGRPEKLEDDDEAGGIADRPGDTADVFHTLFGIAGLSLLGHPDLDEVDPRYCMPKSHQPFEAMPPKKAGGKKGKKPEVDKQVAEEEERKRLEEEARLLEIRQKKEKDLREQREREALDQLFNQEKDRLDEENSYLKEISERHTSEISRAIRSEKSQTEWKKFLECSSLPDPNDERELNTYLSLLGEEQLGSDDDPSLKPLLDVLPNAEKLCNDLATEMTSALDAQNESKYTQTRSHLLHLREIIHSQWDLMTCRILQVSYPLFSCLRPDVNSHTLNIHKTIEYTNINLSMSLPKPISLANVSIRMLYEYGMTATAPYFVQDTKKHMSVVGGVLYLGLCEMPDAPKNLDTWVIRQILSPTGKLKDITYPFKKTVTEAAEEEKEGVADVNIWPAQVCYEIFPQCFIHKESAKVMYWDESLKSWSEENIGDVEINIEMGQVKFRTIHFRPTALVQSTYSEFPFQDWTLSLSTPTTALLNIKGTTNDIQIEIGEGWCQLLNPKTPYLEENLIGKKMGPSLLLARLSQVGLNFTAPKSLKGVDIESLILKSPIVEEICVYGVGLCVAGFHFRRSPSNRHLSTSKIVFQIQEITPNQEASNDPTAWRTLFFDSSYKIGDNTHKLGFFVADPEVTDETKFDTTNSDKFKPNDKKPLK